MILSDREIRAAVERGDISITPLPLPNSKAWSSTALDLRLDREVRKWQKIKGSGQLTAISPALAEFNTYELIARHTVKYDCTNGFTIGPGELVLGWTVETLKFPHRAKLAARIEGKSGLARIGLGVHVNAPTVHAGFGVNSTDPNYPGSPIRLEMWNAGPLEIVLTYDMPICQLIIEEVHGTPHQGYSGVYAVQGPT